MTGAYRLETGQSRRRKTSTTILPGSAVKGLTMRSSRSTPVCCAHAKPEQATSAGIINSESRSRLVGILETCAQGTTLDSKSLRHECLSRRGALCALSSLPIQCPEHDCPSSWKAAGEASNPGHRRDGRSWL